jgi:hypothetical protein
MKRTNQEVQTPNWLYLAFGTSKRHGWPQFYPAFACLPSAPAIQEASFTGDSSVEISSPRVVTSCALFARVARRLAHEG